MKHRTIAAALALPIVLSVGPAHAQVAAPDEITRNVFAEQDADGNGEIDPSEVVAFDERMFATADANTDGLLSEEEFVVTDMGGAAYARERDQLAEYEDTKRALFASLDRSGDGALSRAELLAGIFESFRAADADENARISDSEFADFDIATDGLTGGAR